MDKQTIYIIVGFDTARKRFNEFYKQSVSLAKKGLLKRANKENLMLATDHYEIRFVPNTNADLIHGLKCTWAYGFDPISTKRLEFRVSNALLMLKPLVESTTELIQHVAEMEEKWKE